MVEIPGYSPTEVLATIEYCADRVGQRFQFAYFDDDDIKQSASLFALEALAAGGYDPSRPLANFLYSHMVKRVLNLRRDKLVRCDPPCRSCHEGDFCTGGWQPCPRYARWAERNKSKASLAGSTPQRGDGPDDRSFGSEDDVAEDAARAELLARVDAEISLELRADWLRLRAGVRIPKTRRLAVEQAVRQILGDDLGEAE
jgi:hypothetical protein